MLLKSRLGLSRPLLSLFVKLNCIFQLLIDLSSYRQLRTQTVRKTGLKNHISSQHVSRNINFSSESKKSANLQCKVCPKGFSTKALLQRHALKEHNSVRLRCLHCPKEFPNERSMSDHLSLHTGIKPYRCVYCGFLSKKRNNLFCHIEKAHDKRHERSDIFVIEDQERQMKMITKKELALVIKKAKMAACQ